MFTPIIQQSLFPTVKSFPLSFRRRRNLWVVLWEKKVINVAK